MPDLPEMLKKNLTATCALSEFACSHSSRVEKKKCMASNGISLHKDKPMNVHHKFWKNWKAASTV
jgi:hypothetical protein